MKPSERLRAKRDSRRARMAGSQRQRGLISRIALAGAALVAALLLGGVLATASHAQQSATAYENVGEFGEFGSGNAQFERDPGPGRIAVHEQSGKVFVADTGNHRIQAFDPVHPGDPGDDCGASCATYDFELGDSTTTNTPIGVAVDQQTADLYVIAAGTTNAIVKFSPATPGVPADYTHVTTGFTSPSQGTGPGEIGSFGQIGVAGSVHRGAIVVDPLASDLFLADPGRDLIQRFDSSGAHIDDFDGSGSPGGSFQDLFDLAVDSSGDILVVDHVSGEGIRVERFDSDGTWQASLPMPDDVSEMEGLAVGASLAVNLDTDEVFVGYRPPGPFGEISWQIAQFEINEFGDHTLVRTFGAPDDGFDWFINGIGARVDDDEGRLYAAALSGHPALGGVPRVQVFDDIGSLADPPEPRMCQEDPVTGITATEATFCGTIDHGGIEAEWRFEYRPTEGPTDWLPAPVPNGELDGEEEVPVDVAATATDLEPNTDYEVRLWAENDVDDRTSVDVQGLVDGLIEFKTDAAAPSVSGLIVTPGATMASVRAAVNPRNSETDWRIEYRPSGSGQWTEVAAGSAGDGGTPVPVMDRAYDLSPSTQYEVRIVAENEVGTEEEGEVVETGTAPPERAYELVSPLPTGGVNVDTGSGIIAGRAASEDGTRALFSTFTVPLPGMGGTLYQRYVTERSAEAWVTRPVDEQSAGFGAAMSRDGSHVLFSDRRHGLTSDYDSDDQNEAVDLYLRGPFGELTWVSRDLRVPHGEPQTDNADVLPSRGPIAHTMSVDGRTVAFMSARNLLDADPHPSSSTASDGRLYKWSDGELDLIGVLPGASDPPQPGDVPKSSDLLGHLLGQGTGWYPNAVSRDGSRVFWRADGTIYASVEGHGTLEIAAGAYRGAAADGSRVFYTSGGNLFAFDVDLALSGSGDPVTSITDEGDVLGVAGIASLGTHVYFVSNAVMTEAEAGPAGTTPSEQGRNLYRAKLGSDGSVSIRFVAGPLGSGSPPHSGSVADSFAVWGSDNEAHWTFNQSFAAPDGGVLAFGSWVALIPGQSTGGFRQMYVYDDAENTLVCASCMADGSAPRGVVNVEDVGSGRAQAENAKIRWVTSDGTVFFQSYSQLLPQVENDATDVYAYRDGELTLISAGTGLQPSTFHDASADGESVFFRTGDALVPADNEPGTVKLYAARVGGGIESQQKPPPSPVTPCVGDACRDDVDEPERAADPSSEGFRGAGNRAGAEQCAVHVRQFRIARHRAIRLARQSRAIRQVARRLARQGASPRRVVRTRRLSARANRAARVQVMRARDARERLNVCRSLLGEEQ